MKIDERIEILKIEYDAGENMTLVRISNDSLLLFYLELKKNDPQLTTYFLHVEVLHVANILDSTFGPYLGMPRSINLLSSSSSDVPMISDV